jgi:Zn-dependent protease/CBS domain-containing protein
MNWSLRVGRFFGIDVFIHWTFFLLLGGIVYAQYAATKSWSAAAAELLFVALVFAIIVMHEYGHALTARLFGVKTRDIILLPIGGVARLERIPENPAQELLIAVAGPMVNVVLAIGLAAWLIGTGQLRAGMPEDMPNEPLEVGLLERLLIINIVLVVFNMIPAFPMDGGRVLRALLALGMSHLRATQIAARVGQGIAILAAIFAIYSTQYMLLLVALFVWVGAQAELAMATARAGLAGLFAHHAMLARFLVVRPTDSLEALAPHVLSGYQSAIPVLDGDQLVGLLTPEQLRQAMAQGGGHGRVADIMQRDFDQAAPHEPLATVIERMQLKKHLSLPVVEQGRLIGLITAESIRGALQQAKSPSTPQAVTQSSPN